MSGDPLTEFLSELPTLAATLLDVHIADQHGDCAGCASQVRSVRWPCQIRDMALEASETRRNGAQ
jgi:hypothetical protein